MKTPIYTGQAQSDLDFAAFKALNANLSDYAGANMTWNATTKKFDSASGSGANPLITANVKSSPYNATGNGSTDDTAAIQSALNAVVAAGGGTVFFPKGIYFCNGAFDGITNSILKVPAVAQTSVPVGIELLGEASVGWVGPWWTTGPIIKSTKTGTGTAPALLAAGPSYGDGSVAVNLFNNIILHIRKLAFVTNNNPTIHAVRLDTAGVAAVEDVVIGGGTSDYVNAAPTGGTSGLWMPNAGNFAENFVNRTLISGFDTGMKTGEHLRCPEVTVGANNVGVKFLDSFAQSWANILCNHNIHNVAFSGNHPVDLFLHIEHADPAAPDAWAVTTADIYDNLNAGTGIIRYTLIDANHGFSPNPILVTGGAKINLMNLHTGNTTTVAGLPASASIGQRMMVTDGAASLAWGATVTGGGTAKYLAWWNGANWTVAGK